MDKNKQIFLTPIKYAQYTGISDCCDKDKEEKQNNKLKKIEQFLTENIINSQIKQELISYINQLIEIQNNLSKYNEDFIILSCENISKLIASNETLVRINDENSKYKGSRLDTAIQNKIMFFNTSSYHKDEEKMDFLIAIRNDLIELFEWYINDSELKNIINQKEIKTGKVPKNKQIRDLANKDPNLTYAQIAERIGTSAQYVKKVMNYKVTKVTL